MATLDPAGEFLRITEHYRQMSDSELLVLIPQSSQLTPLAQQALASEVRSRGLKLQDEDEEAPTPPKPERSVFYGQHSSNSAESSVHDSSALDPSALDSQDDGLAGGQDSPDERDSSYDEDRKLVELCTVWSVRDALQVQTLLDQAGIPFFMGPEKATGVDTVTSSFVNGVSVQIMRIGLPWAAQAMQHYEPADEPARKPEEEPAELVVRCPQCNSDEVVFEGGTSSLVFAGDDSSQKYRWSCDSCGCEWEDDGIAKEE